MPTTLWACKFRSRRSVEVTLRDFTDILGRHFRQPAEGMGFDGNRVAHMWRTIMWPTGFL